VCKTGSDSETDNESDYDPETEPESESDHDSERESASESNSNSSSGVLLPSPAYDKISSNVNQFNPSTSTNSVDFKRKRSTTASST
jgi:hypothetical protein